MLLSQNRLSDNVAPVKHFLGVLTRALRRARHFALVEGSAIPTNQGPLVIRFRSETQFDPCISSVCNCDHDYYFELLREEERDAQSITRCSTAHHGDFRAVPRANRTFSPARNPIPFATSNTDEPLVCGPWRPLRFSALFSSSGEDTCCATRARCAPSPAPLPPA